MKQKRRCLPKPHCSAPGSPQSVGGGSFSGPNRMARLAAGVPALLASAVLATPPAAAAPSTQTAALCGGSPVTCSIQVAPVVSESSLTTVAVTGMPGVTVEIELRRADLSASTVTGLTPLAATVQVTTDANGFGSVDLPIPTLPDGQAGGPVLFVVADSTGTHWSELLGTWSLLTARTPVLLGDGYAELKPVGVPLELRLAAVPSAGWFAVEFTDAAGQLQTASDPAAPPCADQRCTVGYTVPRGLAATDYSFRLVDRSTGAVVAAWTVRPDAAGVPQPPRAMPELPAVGAGVPGSITAQVGATSNPVPQPRSDNLDLPEVGSGVVGAREGDAAGRTLLIGSAAVALGGFALVLVAGWRASRHRLQPRLARMAVRDDD